MADSPAIGVTVTESMVGEHTMTIPSGANVLRLTLIGAPGGTIPTINGFPATGGVGNVVAGSTLIPVGVSTLYAEVGGPGGGPHDGSGGYNGGGTWGVGEEAAHRMFAPLLPGLRAPWSHVFLSPPAGVEVEHVAEPKASGSKTRVVMVATLAHQVLREAAVVVVQAVLGAAAALELVSLLREPELQVQTACRAVSGSAVRALQVELAVAVGTEAVGVAAGRSPLPAVGVQTPVEAVGADRPIRQSGSRRLRQ